MGHDALAEEFRRRLIGSHLLLDAWEPEQDRFVFDLKSGSLVIDKHPGQARQLLLLAEAVYTKGRGEAHELARLIARRADLEHGVPRAVAWQAAAKAHASAPEAYDAKEWIAFEDWIADQFLLEDAIAKMDEGVPI